MLPILIFLAVLSSHLVNILLGSEWTSAAQFLTLLALFSIPAVITVTYFPLTYILCRPEVYFKRGIIELLVRIPSLTIGALCFGVVGGLVAIGASNLVTSYFVLQSTRKLSGISYSDQLRPMLRPAIACIPLTIFSIVAEHYLFRVNGLSLIILTSLVLVVSAVIYASFLILCWNLARRPVGPEHGLLLLLRRVRYFRTS